MLLYIYYAPSSNTMIIDRSTNYLFSSDPAAGAQNINDDGNQFSVLLNDPLSIPKEAVYCTIEVVNAVIVNVMPNVSEEYGNNKIVFDHEAKTYDFTFPDGLYAVEDINAFLTRSFEENGLPADLFVFTGEASTQKVILTFNYAGTQVDFLNEPNSINELLGFDPLLYPQFAPSVAGESFTSQSQAQINRITSWFLHCDLARSGIPVNAIGSNIVAQVPIPANSVGKTVGWSPFNPIPVNCDHLIGHPINAIDCRLSDQLDRNVLTLGEAFSMLVRIRYGIQVSDHSERSQRYRNARQYAAH